MDTAQVAVTDGRIVENVIKARKRSGLTQAELAERLVTRGQTHWRQSTVSRVETGERPLTAADVMDLTAALDGADLFEGVQLYPGDTWFKLIEREVVMQRFLAIEDALGSVVVQVASLRDSLGLDAKD